VVAASDSWNILAKHFSQYKAELESVRIIALAIFRVDQSNLAQDMLTFSEMNSVLALPFYKVESAARREARSYPRSALGGFARYQGRKRYRHE
jgi:hypothetical protein